VKKKEKKKKEKEEDQFKYVVVKLSNFLDRSVDNILTS
jgi:hypothetical protein